MKLQNMDVVYIVKSANINEELRYSIRSVVKNMPHRNIVIVGYCPLWLKGLPYVKTDQRGSKYKNAELNWQAAMNSPTISDDFVLFNDDFFIMKPITEIPVLHRGNLDDVIKYYSGKPSQYLDNMEYTRTILNKLGFTDLKSYALHMPMVMNKKKRKLLQQIIALVNPNDRDSQMRTLYGNFWRVGGEQSEDVKAYKRSGGFNKDWTFISTSDDSFKYGDVGRFIRAMFPEKTKYEV